MCTGKVTLWVPGTDHAGIATQSVVEKRLKKVINMEDIIFLLLLLILHFTKIQFCLYEIVCQYYTHIIYLNIDIFLYLYLDFILITLSFSVCLSHTYIHTYYIHIDLCICL